MGRRLSGVLSVAKQLRQAAIRLKDAKNLLVSNRGTRDESQIEIDELLRRTWRDVADCRTR